MKVNGTDTPNHNNINATNVVNGKAPVDCLAQTNKFKTKEMPKTAPGNKNADSNALDFQALPSNNLYKRDAL